MNLTPEITGHILEFIRARHFGDMRESINHQTWLKKRLKKAFVPVLLKNGDPDRDGYMEVMMKWFEEERLLLQGESGR